MISVSDSLRADLVVDPRRDQSLLTSFRGRAGLCHHCGMDRIDKRTIEHEESIVWLEDISDLPYVREAFAMDDKRIGPIRLSGSKRRLAGYANVGPSGRIDIPGTDICDRRIFYLCDHDPYGYEPSQMPSEAVEPLSAGPRVPGNPPWPRPRAVVSSMDPS